MRLFFFLLLSLFLFPLYAAAPVLVGEISEAKVLAPQVLNERRGIELAVEDINARGGVWGRPLQIVSRNGGDGSPAEVLRDAADLVERQGVQLLLCPVMDNNSLAVSAYTNGPMKRHVKECRWYPRRLPRPPFGGRPDEIFDEMT